MVESGRAVKEVQQVDGWFRLKNADLANVWQWAKTAAAAVGILTL